MTPKRPVDAMAWLRLFRHRMVSLLLGTVTALGTIGILYILSSYVSARPKRVSVRLIAYLAAYVLLLALFLARRLPVRWRALGFLALLYAFAIFSFTNGWLGSNARGFLLALTVLTGILVGPRAGVVAAIVSLLTFAAFGTAYARGWLVYEMAPEYATPSIIIIEGIGFCMAMGMVSIGLWFFRAGLTAATEATEDARQSRELLAERAQELDAANQELEAFAYSVSHDMRAPLRHIDGFVHLLADREVERLDPTSRHYMESIVQATGKMARLIDDLLTLSRSARADMQWHHVDLDELIPIVQQEVLSGVLDRNIEWQIASLPAVAGDSSLLRQVWVNLLSNAVKYTAPREQALIEIGVVAQEQDSTGEVTVFVRDNGVGFDPQYADKLFGVFQRLHQADEFEGTGIGLALVQRIVRRHGGRVWAEGKVNGGATFYLTLKSADMKTD